MTEAPLPPCQDLLAVGYGEFDLSYQNPGLVCCWSLKNHTVEPSTNVAQVLPPRHKVMASCVAVARSIHPLRLRRHLPGFLPQQPKPAGGGDDQRHHRHLWCADSGEQGLRGQQLVRTRRRQVSVAANGVVEAKSETTATASSPSRHCCDSENWSVTSVCHETGEGNSATWKNLSNMLEISLRCHRNTVVTNRIRWPMQIECYDWRNIVYKSSTGKIFQPFWAVNNMEMQIYVELFGPFHPLGAASLDQIGAEMGFIPFKGNIC